MWLKTLLQTHHRGVYFAPISGTTTSHGLSFNYRFLHGNVPSCRKEMRLARKKRQEEIANKMAAVQSMLQSSKAPVTSSTPKPSSQQNDQNLHLLAIEQESLQKEAASFTKSLYRTCLRCIRVIRPGNKRDEAEFAAREAARLIDMEQSFVFVPPIDRNNELSSRASYYRHSCWEQFHGEAESLERWGEENVQRYLRFLRKGEYQRTWILNDYDFKDPFPDKFDEEKVMRWEQRARRLASELIKSDHQHQGESNIGDEEEIWSDEEEVDWDDTKPL